MWGFDTEYLLGEKFLTTFKSIVFGLWLNLKIKLGNRVKNIQIFVDENDAIEGITLVSHFEELFPNLKKERRFGKTTKVENICADSCEMELAEDELVTGLSYRKSTAGVGKFSTKW